MPINIEEKMISKFLFDSLFYTFGYYMYFKDIFGVLLIIAILIAVFFKSNIYNKPIEVIHFFDFIDFLNLIYSNLSVGMPLNQSILALQKEGGNRRRGELIDNLKKNIAYANDDEAFYKVLLDGFNIPESKLFVQLLKQSKITGTSVSEVVGLILEQLRVKTKTKREIESILMQKKMEQSILAIAPIGIVLLIDNVQPNYLGIMYSTFEGRAIMASSFLTLIFMKWISGRLIKIRTD